MKKDKDHPIGHSGRTVSLMLRKGKPSRSGSDKPNNWWERDEVKTNAPKKHWSRQYA